jgi:hypothetical protein
MKYHLFELLLKHFFNAVNTFNSTNLSSPAEI